MTSMFEQWRTYSLRLYFGPMPHATKIKYVQKGQLMTLLALQVIDDGKPWMWGHWMCPSR